MGLHREVHVPGDGRQLSSAVCPGFREGVNTAKGRRSSSSRKNVLSHIKKLCEGKTLSMLLFCTKNASTRCACSKKKIKAGWLINKYPWLTKDQI